MLQQVGKRAISPFNLTQKVRSWISLAASGHLDQRARLCLLHRLTHSAHPVDSDTSGQGLVCPANKNLQATHQPSDIVLTTSDSH